MSKTEIPVRFGIQEAIFQPPYFERETALDLLLRGRQQIRGELTRLKLVSNLARLQPFLLAMSHEDQTTIAECRLLLEHPGALSPSAIDRISEVVDRKVASLPVQRRSMEFRSEARTTTNRRVKFIVSRSDVIDRHSTRIETSGIDLTNYRKNPIFCWAHNAYSTFFGVPAMEDVIGRAVGFRQDSKVLELEIEFFTEDVNPKSAQALRMIRAGGLQATSIGFIPKKTVVEMVDGKEIPVIVESELLECSLVTIPSNTGVEVTGGRARASA